MLAKIHSCTIQGFDAILLEVEVDISFGLPVYAMVGLAEIAVKESRERVRAAIQNSGYTFPMDRVVVNLAPADIKKDGTGLDLPVALGLLTACELLPKDAAAPWLIIGELSLDGQLKPVKGALVFALLAREQGFRGIVLPLDNAREAAQVNDIEVIGAVSLGQVVDFLAGNLTIAPSPAETPSDPDPGDLAPARDFSQVAGQHHAKRAFEIAAAGNHHLLMSGPPGSGKSMMAKRLPGILPKPSFEERMEIARLYSIVGKIKGFDPLSGHRPFRSPHHSISDAGLVGGGSTPLPGEISLAHNGVLFLDELPEFRRNVLEVLRQPLEDGLITLARAGAKATYPCRFMLVGAMNPCPCGNFGNPAKACVCPAHRVRQYRSKISGPLLDRMDIQVEVPQVPYKDLASHQPSESSAAIQQRVTAARRVQYKRFGQTGVFSNAAMTQDQIRTWCALDGQGQKTAAQLMKQFAFSARAYASILKVARTIADLACQENINRSHLLEAVQYKAFDREH